MNKKGFTLIELMGIIIILSLISLLVIPTIDKSIKLFKENAYNNQIKNIQLATKNWGSDHLYNYRFNNGDVITVTLGQLKSQAYINDNLKNPLTGYLFPDDMLIHIVKGVKKITYVVEDGTGTPNFNPYNANSPTIYLNGSYVEEVYQGKIYLDKGVIAQTSTGTLITAVTKVITKDGLTVGSVNTAILGTYLVSYSVTDSSLTRTAFRTVNIKQSIPLVPNAPVLATGMIPVYYDSTANGGLGGWEKADSTNTNTTYKWYDYNAQMWANAVTASATNRATYLAAASGTLIPEADILTYMVWIPRYGYQIATGYHLSTTGTINIKFLQGTTNTTPDSTPIVTIPTYTGSVQTNYIKHPAFTFGATELTGLWVAKFEVSGTTIDVDSKPSVTSLRNIDVGIMFDASRNMETNARYGWGTTGANIDTHLMKNSEWGAVAYLSKSIYGQNTNEIWINPADTYTTGCAGNSVSSSYTVGCNLFTNSYVTTNGVKASTTGNIYGIYDISGGAYEYTAAYVNNGNANLATYGNSIITANAKYKDVYPITTDSGTDNYNNAINVKGDSVYETSSSYIGATSWYTDYSYMPATNAPWFVRVGYYNNTTSAGAFVFSSNTGSASIRFSFRFVIGVAAGI